MPSYDSVPASHRDLLEGRHLAVLSTVGADGDPQSTAVWFLLDGDDVLMSTRTPLQKYRNIVAHPRVALFVADPTTHFRALEIRGPVSITADPDGAFFERIAVAYGQDLVTFPGLRDRRVVLRLRPDHATTVGIPRRDRQGLKPVV